MHEELAEVAVLRKRQTPLGLTEHLTSFRRAEVKYVDVHSVKILYKAT
jgi:hypothetical protein